MPGKGAKRDPVSVLFDAPARRLLERAYSDPRVWKSTRLGEPSLRARTYALKYGIDVDGPDNASVHGGARLNARSAWARAFVRALYYQHKWYSKAGKQQTWQRRSSPRSASALRIEVGRMLPATGVIPRGRAIRVKLDAGGQAKQRAVARLPDSARIWTDDGQPAARFSDPALRPWQ